MGELQNRKFRNRLLIPWKGAKANEDANESGELAAASPKYAEGKPFVGTPEAASRNKKVEAEESIKVDPN